MNCDELIDLLNTVLEQTEDIEVIGQDRRERIEKTDIIYHFGEADAYLVLTVGHWGTNELYYHVGAFSQVTKDVTQIVALVRREARSIIHREIYA